MASEKVGRFCAVCGERVGTYEPVVVLSERVLWHTSLAQDPELMPADVLMHATCATFPLDEKTNPDY
ncbi:MAG TPA: hypothetical protein VKR21_03140 [Solirubrobacteraceae bacterium]|nr:hypothetical protein [Solirubrobacteraceae bacterium]